MEILLTIGFFGIIWGIMALSPYFIRSEQKGGQDCETDTSLGGCGSCGSQGSCGLYQAVSQKPGLTKIKKI